MLFGILETIRLRGSDSFAELKAGVWIVEPTRNRAREREREKENESEKIDKQRSTPRGLSNVLPGQ